MLFKHVISFWQIVANSAKYIRLASTEFEAYSMHLGLNNLQCLHVTIYH